MTRLRRSSAESVANAEGGYRPASVTPLDWVIVGFTLLMCLWGYMQGLIAGGLSLVGFGAGALLGSRLAPLVLDEGSKSPYAPLGALMGALLVGAVLATVLEMLGFRLRQRLHDSLGVADGLGGSVLVGALGLGLAWILGAVALQIPGGLELREPIQRSLILRRLNATLPPSGPLLRALARFDPFPRITGPEPGVRAPEPAIARDPEVRAAGRSVVKVIGTACGLGIQGSGWIAAGGLVVTNAHVVAGEDDTTLLVAGEGPRYRADAIWFDPQNDLAILRPIGMGAVPPLPLDTSAAVGTSAAVLGFPGDGDYDVQPARLGRTRTVISQDSYGRGPVRRSITAVRGLVRSGNSGGPMVDGQGRVVTTIFAATVRSGSGSGFGVPIKTVRDALRRAHGPVGTGPCAR